MMNTLQQIFLIFGALFGFLGVAAGAFGAHFLKSRLPVDSLNIFEVAVRYQMYHALVLITLVAFVGLFPSIWLTIAGWLFITGVVIFSGSLYALLFSGIRLWGAITPIGGLFLLMGWLALLLAGIIAGKGA
jgi:uncharacterized membrane protein YgdD (TMEM256/DUF423 family)